jgi:N-acetylneuraminic acid mutarotase
MKSLVFFISLFFISQSFCLSQNVWTQKSDFIGIKRVGGAGFAIDSMIYFGSGIDSTNTLRTDFWKYDPGSNSWSQVADIIGSPLYWAMGFSVSGKGYICLGQDASGANPKSVFEYDPTLNSWSLKSDFPGVGRIYSVAFTIGPYAYLGGGSDIGTFQLYSDFWQYDPSVDNWTQKTDIGFGSLITEAAGFSQGGKGYIGTGAASCFNCALKEFWSYDTTSNSWTQLTDFGGDERLGTSGFSLGGYGYIGFGRDTNFMHKTDLWQYDIINNIWNQVASMPTWPGFGSFIVSNGEGAYLQRGMDPLSNLSYEFYRFGPVSPGVEELEYQHSISVYPNPVTAISFVKTDNFLHSKIYNCEIVNDAGKVVWKHANLKVPQLHIRSNDFRNGIYYLRLKDISDKIMITKFIIQN